MPVGRCFASFETDSHSRLGNHEREKPRVSNSSSSIDQMQRRGACHLSSSNRSGRPAAELPFPIHLTVLSEDSSMTTLHTAYAAFITIALTGCASVQYGDKNVEAKLKTLTPVAGKVSLYVCREPAVWLGAGARSTVIVNNEPVGTLKPNNFSHVLLEPGTHGIKVKNSPGGESGILNVTAKSGEVPIIWLGMTGGGFGTLTVDLFTTRIEAEQCVKGAEYAVPST